MAVTCMSFTLLVFYRVTFTKYGELFKVIHNHLKS